MSPCGVSPKFDWYVFCESLSHSEEKTQVPPASSKAILITPIPANRSMKLKGPLSGRMGGGAGQSKRAAVFVAVARLMSVPFLGEDYKAIPT